MAKYNIGGYIFSDENSARLAAKELKAVEYILGQIKVADEQEVLKIYKKLLDQRLFSTQIGMSFLTQLRQNLIASEAFDEADVPEVYSLDEKPSKDVKEEPKGQETQKENEVPQKEVPDSNNKKIEKEKKKRDKVKTRKKAKENEDSEVDIGVVKRLRLINSFLIICVFTLLLCVIGMFYVSTTINSPTILNYKEVITDEYSSWKQQLDAREKELDEREAELDARESKISGIEGN